MICRCFFKLLFKEHIKRRKTDKNFSLDRQISKKREREMENKYNDDKDDKKIFNGLYLNIS